MYCKGAPARCIVAPAPHFGTAAPYFWDYGSIYSHSGGWPRVGLARTRTSWAILKTGHINLPSWPQKMTCEPARYARKYRKIKLALDGPGHKINNF